MSKELDKEFMKARELAADACIGFGGVKWCERDGTRLMNVETQKYNARELDKTHWSGIMGSLLANEVEVFAHPVIIAVDPKDILNIDELLDKDTKNPTSAPIVRFRSRNVHIILLAGQHRIEASVNTVPVLCERGEMLKDKIRDVVVTVDEEAEGEVLDVEMTDAGMVDEDEEMDEEKEGDEVRQLQVAVAGTAGTAESEKMGEKGLTKKQRELKDLKARLELTQEETVLVQNWYAQLFDISEWMRWNTKDLWTDLRIDKLRKGNTTKQLFRVLAENTSLKERPKMMQELILDAVTDLVEYDGKKEAERVRKAAPKRTARVRDILVRAPLCDTLYHVARLSDAFKIGKLFKVEWLGSKLLKNPMGEVSRACILYPTGEKLTWILDADLSDARLDLNVLSCVRVPARPEADEVGGDQGTCRASEGWKEGRGRRSSDSATARYTCSGR